MRFAMIRINQALGKNSSIKTKMLLQIHDELVFETPKSEFEKIVPIIKKNMIEASSSEHHILSTSLTVDLNSGNNWGEVN